MKSNLSPFHSFLVVVFCMLMITASLQAQWVQTNGQALGYVRCLAARDTLLFAGTNGSGVYLTTNNGTNWTSTGLSSGDVDALGFSGTTLFAGTNGDGIYRSMNNGASWTAVNTGLGNHYVSSFAVSGTNLFAGTFTGVFLSMNDGDNWTSVNSGLTQTGGISALIFSGANLFAGTVGNGVFRSSNNGSSWSLDYSGQPLYISAFAVNGSNLYAANESGGVYRSTNNGINWVAPSTNFGFSWVYALVVSGSNLFAGVAGINLSTNSGAGWINENLGLTQTSVTSLAVSGSNLFAGFGVSGVWRRPLSEMVTSVLLPSNELPKEIGLDQNYPNPFNPSTNIRYALPHTSFVTLTIYNTLGQQVAQLVDEQQQAGYHDVVFRGDALSSGVYFYRIQAGDFVASKKLLLLK